MTPRRALLARRVGPLRRRFQPVRLILERCLRARLGATRDGAPIALAVGSRVSAVG